MTRGKHSQLKHGPRYVRAYPLTSGPGPGVTRNGSGGYPQCPWVTLQHCLTVNFCLLENIFAISPVILIGTKVFRAPPRFLEVPAACFGPPYKMLVGYSHRIRRVPATCLRSTWRVPYRVWRLPAACCLTALGVFPTVSRNMFSAMLTAFFRYSRGMCPRDI